MEDISWKEFDGDTPLGEDFTYSYHPEVGGFVIEDYKGEKSDILLPETTTQDGITAPVAGIAAYAFYGRTNLHSVALPYSVRYLGEYCFAKSGIENLYLTGNVTMADDKAFEDFSPRTYTKDKIEYLPTRESPYGFAINAPWFEKGEPYKGFGQNHVELPKGCVGFRNHLFDYFDGDVFIPQTCSVLGDITLLSKEEREIRDGTSYYMNWNGEWDTDTYKIEKMPKVVLKSGETEYYRLFAWGTKILRIDASTYFGDLPAWCFSWASGEVILGENVFSLGDSAFSGYGRQSFVCPKNLKAIGESCFYNSSIAQITLNEGLESIGEEAFYDCEDLKNLTLPSTLKSIGNFAFSGTGISSLVVPESVTEVGYLTFASSLKLVDLSQTKLECCLIGLYDGQITNFVIPSTATEIAVAAGCTVFYYGTPQEFEKADSSRNRGSTYFYSKLKPTDSLPYWHYDKDGVPVIWN